MATSRSDTCSPGRAVRVAAVIQLSCELPKIDYVVNSDYHYIRKP